MTTYRAIAATETDPQAPITSALMKALQSNVLAMFEGDATASTVRLQYAALDAGMRTEGGIGSYALARFSTPTSAGAGSTHAGSGLSYASADGGGSSALSGTWRLMGRTAATDGHSATSLFVRIS